MTRTTTLPSRALHVGAKLTLAVLLAGALALPAFAQTITAAMQTNPPTLDPHMTTTTATQQIAIHVFEPLVVYGEDYSTVLPMLAASWEASDDDLTYTFTLREGVLFHNGKELRAEDAVASLDRIRTHSPVSGFYEGVSAIEVTGDYTFEVTLDQPIDLIASMAVPVTWQGIMPKEQADAAGSNELRVGELIGTGPFELSAWRPDVEVVLDRLEDYAAVDIPASGFGGHKEALVEQVRFVPVREVGSRIAGLETGEYHFAEALPITAMGRLEDNTNVEPLVAMPLWGVAWEINKQEPPMDNVYFRRAVLAALDMDFIMRTVAMGDPNFYRVQPGRFYPEQTALYSDACAEEYNRADPDYARELLAQAGYDGEDIVILSNRDYDWMYRATLAAAPQLEQAGINVRLEFSDWPSQIGKALTLEDWHINQTGWSLNFNLTDLKGGLQSGAPYAYGYENPDMDAALERASFLLSPEELRASADEIQCMILTDVPYIRFGDLFGLEAVRTTLDGYASWYVVPRFWNVSLD